MERLIFFFLFYFFHSGRTDLSDFGGDVKQYMSLLQGSSAFSFSPQKGDEEKRELAGPTGASPMGDFGGDYGDYLKLLEGNSALGFNPQADPIGDNQELQSDVFGGGATQKFWNMYKGSTSYDSFDDSDAEVVQELKGDSDDEDPDDDSLFRQSKEYQDPEDAPNSEQTEERVVKTGKTVVVHYKPSKAKMAEIYAKMKEALKSKDSDVISDIIKELENGSSESTDMRRSMPKETIVKDSQSNDDDEPAYSGEAQNEARITGVQKSWEEFVKKMAEITPDPVLTSKGLSMSYKNLTLFGLSKASTCGKVRKSFSQYKGYICMSALTSTVDSTTGPGVPFKGRVAAIFKSPKIEISFKEASGKIHVTSVRMSSEKSKFVPTYDSSIPLNPWSKVSMSGYMVSRIKKVMPSLVEKMILRITHVVEKLDQ